MSNLLTSMMLSEQQSIALLNMLSKYVPETAVSDNTLYVANTANFGNIFKHNRQTRGLKSKDVAEQVGYSCAWVSRMERGQIPVDLTTMKKLAHILGYTYVCIGCDDCMENE